MGSNDMSMTADDAVGFLRRIARASEPTRVKLAGVVGRVAALAVTAPPAEAARSVAQAAGGPELPGGASRDRTERVVPIVREFALTSDFPDEPVTLPGLAIFVGLCVGLILCLLGLDGVAPEKTGGGGSLGPYGGRLGRLESYPAGSP
jgi:hypothetical protein